MAPATSAAKKTTSLKTLQTKLKGLHTSFKNIQEFVTNYPEDSTHSQITVRLERLEELWEKIGEVVYEVESHEEFALEGDSFTNERLEFENSYFNIKSFLIDKSREVQNPLVLEQTVRQVDTIVHGFADHVRLPQIKLHSFNGNIDEWISFRDLYTSLIHWKPDLSEMEKFHYLKETGSKIFSRA